MTDCVTIIKKILTISRSRTVRQWRNRKILINYSKPSDLYSGYQLWQVSIQQQVRPL